MKIIANNDHFTLDNGLKSLKSLEIDNTVDPRDLDLAGIDRVVLKFPRFTSAGGLFVASQITVNRSSG